MSSPIFRKNMKKVKVRIPDRDKDGKVMKDVYTHIVGNCTFYGFNSFLDCDVIVVDRTPIFPVSKEDIEFL